MAEQKNFEGYQKEQFQLIFKLKEVYLYPIQIFIISSTCNTLKRMA